MIAVNTESSNSRSAGIDQSGPIDALGLLLDGQIAAATSVRHALPAIAEMANVMAQTIKNGGRLFYAAAGSSGLMAMADALEIPGTFGIPMSRIVVLFAGGVDALHDMVGGVEDDIALARADVLAHEISSKDFLIALSASGTTPYALAILEVAKSVGAKSAGVANNAGSPLLNGSDIKIYLPTPPEVLAGSTRMGAGTAQKIALNMASTLMAIELGHVHDGLMVNVRADNIKLIRRAKTIVATISGCSEDEASRVLELAGGDVKRAVLLSRGVKTLPQAEMLLERSGQKLRPALSEINRAASAGA